MIITNSKWGGRPFYKYKMCVHERTLSLQLYRFEKQKNKKTENILTLTCPVCVAHCRNSPVINEKNDVSVLE